jgi:hypothetical protein
VTPKGVRLLLLATVTELHVAWRKASGCYGATKCNEITRVGRVESTFSFAGNDCVKANVSGIATAVGVP